MNNSALVPIAFVFFAIMLAFLNSTAGGLLLDQYDDSTFVAQRSGLNLISGTGVTVSSADSPANQRVDFTVTNAMETKEATVQVVANSASLDFGAGFDLTDNGSGESAIALDLSELAGAPASLVTIPARKATGGTIPEFTPVYVVSFNVGANAVNVEAADASSAGTMPADGVTTAALTNSANGTIVITGEMSSIDTSGFSIGDHLYVANGGGFTATRPTGTDLIQQMTHVNRSHASSGVAVVFGTGRTNDLPNIPDGELWMGNGTALPTGVTVSDEVTITNAGVATVVTTAMDTETWGSGSGFTWTFDASAGTDPTIVFADGIMTIDGLTDHNWSPTITMELAVGDADEGQISMGTFTLGQADQTVSTTVLDDIVIFYNDAPVLAENISFAFFDQVGGDNPRFIIPTAGVDRATYNPRSMLIGPAATIANMDENILCSTNFASIDCDTAGSGADLGVEDDVEVNGNIFADGGITCTDCIALTSETSGNYLAGLTAGTAIDVGASGEGASPSVDWDSTEVGTTTYGSGSGFTWTFDAGATDPAVAFDSGEVKWEATLGLVVGLQTSAPDPDNDVVHFWDGSAGTVTAQSTDLLTLERSGAASLSILTPASQSGILYFGSPTANARGGIQYNHASDEMALLVASSFRLRYTAGSFAFQEATAVSTTAGDYTINPADQVQITAELVMTGDVNPEADGTRDLGTQTTAQWANVWSDLINGADYAYLNGWRTLESDKYLNYPEGIAIGNAYFHDGVVTEQMPLGATPVFAVTEDFIEYQGIRITTDQWAALADMLKGGIK